MKVLLKRTWFTPRGRFRRSVPANRPVEVPDELRKLLPSDAEIVGDDYKEPKPEKVAETLSEAAAQYGADPDRASAEAADAAAEKAEADQKEMADLAKLLKAEAAAEEKDEPKRGRAKKS